MRLGVIGRGSDRGLGIQSWGYAQYLRPDRTLLVDMGDLERGFAVYPERFPGATVVQALNGVIQQGDVMPWLRGLDVVLTAETFYHPDFPLWAESVGCATCCVPNAEFLPPAHDIEHPATQYLAPTPWRLAHLPEGTKVLPVPVADDRFPFRPARQADYDGPLRVLHVAGHRAAADRNGTEIVIGALPYLRPPMQVTIVSQDARIPYRPSRRVSVDVRLQAGGIADYWRLYDGYDVLVLPRRYGGLSLVAQEAMAAGLALVMSDVEPQRSIWPIVPVQATTSAPRLRVPAGRLPLHTARPEALAGALNDLAANLDLLVAAQERAVAWADAHRWSRWVDRYHDELGRASDARIRA